MTFSLRIFQGRKQRLQIDGPQMTTRQHDVLRLNLGSALGLCRYMVWVEVLPQNTGQFVGPRFRSNFCQLAKSRVVRERDFLRIFDTRNGTGFLRGSGAGPIFLHFRLKMLLFLYSRNRQKENFGDKNNSNTGQILVNNPFRSNLINIANFSQNRKKI